MDAGQIALMILIGLGMLAVVGVVLGIIANIIIDAWKH